MTVAELVSRFPEIPQDLHDEPLLERFAETFDDLLRTAQNPSACSQQYSAENHYYLKLIGPLKIYMYGLSTREKVLEQLAELLERHAADPTGFAASLLPADTGDREVKGPGCE
ncbi:MAG: hypothetical protein D6743_00400 [Calditrichaeota bacterium]|nr:MAG: hypothetical protein D6743_00400 [Calditrichota bacterium]